MTDSARTKPEVDAPTGPAPTELVIEDIFLGLGFDVVCMAARLADPTYAPRLRKLIINGEPNEALLARAHERMLTVEAWHEGCVDTQPVFAG